MTRTESIPMSLKCKINCFKSDIEKIPGPDADPWKWSDIFRHHSGGSGSTDPSIGVKLRSHGLLVKCSDGRFRATRRLNEFMKETHGIDLNVPTRSLEY